MWCLFMSKVAWNAPSGRISGCDLLLFFCFSVCVCVTVTVTLYFPDSSSTSPSAPKESRRSSLESQKVGGEFAEFLKTLRKAPALEVSKQVRGFIERIQHNMDIPVDELSEMVQDFYQNLSDKMATQAVFKGKYMYALKELASQNKFGPVQ